MLFPGIGHEIRVLPQMQEEIHFRVKQLRRKIWGSLWRYAQQDLPKEDRRNAKAYLEDIVLAAVYFDIDIRKDVAETSFFFRRCHIGDGFDPDLMEEARDGDGEGRVSLIVSPPLQREDYPDDVSRAVLLRKAQVVSGVLERLPRKGYQKFIGPMYTPESSQSKQNHFRHVPRPGLLDNGHATGRANQGSRRSNAGRSRHQSADRVHAPRRSSPDSLRSKRGRSTRRL